MKNNFNDKYISLIANEAERFSPGFRKEQFIKEANVNLSDLEMKARIQQIGEAFYRAFNTDFNQVFTYGIALFDQEPHPEKTDWKTGIKYEPLAHIINKYGLDHFDKSMVLLAEITKRYTSEFAIRSFLKAKPAKTLEVLANWSVSNNNHLRRLASEASRTRLPWGEKMINLIQNPTLTRPILENLKTDPSNYVQKSVANHLNDISKDHLTYFYEIIEEWAKINHPSTQWIIKHALRNEIKKGNPQALNILGSQKPDITDVEFTIANESIKLGDQISLTATFKTTGNKKQKLVVDYGIHLCKAGNKSFFKVFKWKLIEVQPESKHTLHKSHTIKHLTTRTFHAGNHQIDLLINGEKMASTNFFLEI